MADLDFRDEQHFLDTPLGGWLLRHRRSMIVGSQLSLVVFSYIFSFLLRFDFDLMSNNQWPLYTMLKTLPLILILRAVAFYIWDLYRGWWRYVGMEDLLDIIKAVGISSLAFTAIVMFVFHASYPRSVFLIDTFICISFIGGIRFLLRAVREYTKLPPRALSKNVLIYGAREIGIEILKEIRANPHLHLHVIGFIDDFEAKKGFKIHGVPVLGGREELSQILTRYGIDEIIIASRTIKARELRGFVERFQDSGLRFRIIPAVRDILGGEVSIKNLRDVDVEDLLGREAVQLDTELIRQTFSGKRVLITGAGGSIGSEIARQVAALFPARLLLLERNENNLFYIHWELARRWHTVPILPVVGDAGDAQLVQSLMADEKPDIILHAAAYKHVPLMETNAVAATLNNIRATRTLAEMAARQGVERFVLISTDKAVRPQNVMGRTKRLAEGITQGLARRGGKTRFLAVRFGNVLASEGSVIPLFRRQIAEGGPVTVTHPEMTRYFMTIPEAVQLVMQAAAMGEGGEIFVLEMGEPVRILDLARNLIKLSGFEPDRDIEIEFVGLRPGEKLKEQLWDDAEGIGPTSHDKIRMVRRTQPFAADFDQRLVELIALAEQGAEAEVRRKLRDLAGPPAETARKIKPHETVDESPPDMTG
ncbi:MAG: polysaccharide biosynthesis protein [Myxococcales bacterium]|nr:polysaccharide biosynthesis protein [Myxococcales bacterium]